MEHILILVLVGFAAQFLGGALGMGYGITCTSMLLLAGLTPFAASSSVHATEVITGLVAGFAHWRLQNVDWRLTARLAVPGCIGALIGGHILARVSTTSAKPWMASMLLALGLFVIARFTAHRGDAAAQPLRGRFLAPLGLGAGFVDATGGGGWGALTTSTLLGTGRVLPRHAVGSADASKCVVSVAAVIGLVSGAGTHGLHATVVAPLIAGGIVAGPLAAYVVTRLPTRRFGILAGIAIVVVNLPVAVGIVPPAGRWTAVGVVLLLTAGVAVAAGRAQQRLATVAAPIT